MRVLGDNSRRWTQEGETKKERKPETQGDRTNEELVQFKVKGHFE